jgi:heat shock protein 40
MNKWCVFTKITSSKQILHNVGIGSIISRGYFNHKEDPLYVPFATDAERELASIQFWVTKNTNLKEVNISLRVILGELIIMCSVPIFPFGVFLLIATFISQKDVPYHPIQMRIE